MDETQRAWVRAACRAKKLGPIDFNSDDTVTIYSQIPIVDYVKSNFPDSQIHEYGEYPLENLITRYYIRFSPSFKVKMAETLKLMA